MRPAALAAILASTTILSGCASTIAGVSLSSISSFAGFASTLFTGADLGEHAASLVTGKDCRFSEGLVRGDRKICEEPGSVATRDDFHGIFIERIDADGTIIYAAPKLMQASVGVGETENNTSAVWAQIKAQKTAEENERQLARADGNQQIDVASLAGGSLSSESLGFLPVGVSAVANIADEAASQKAAQPRDVANAAPPAPTESDQPAIDERSFTASMQIASATGEGGPFIATTTNSTPVVSTLVNGEPVLVMRIGPVMSAITSAPSDHASAMPVEEAAIQEAPKYFSSPSEPEAEPVSPQAVISSLPKAPKAFPTERPVTDFAPTPPLVKAAVKPKAKPAPTQVVAAVPAKPMKAKETIPALAPVARADEDVYQPPSRDVFTSPAPDLTAPAASSETASQPAQPAESAPVPPATSAPAPLIPMAQP